MYYICISTRWLPIRFQRAKSYTTMLTIKRLRDDTEAAIRALAKKGVQARETVGEILACDAQRRQLQAQLDDLLAEVNKASKEIGALMQRGARDEAEAKKQQVAQCKNQTKALQSQEQELASRLRGLLVQLPNLPHSSVPEGKTAADNHVERQVGTVPQLPAGALPHWELAKKLGTIDFELGVKLTGSGFPVYRAAGARLERGLINYFLDQNVAAGYQEVMPPIMVNEASAFATGQLPDKESQMYVVPLDGFYLIPTAEVPVTNILRDQVVEEAQLPIRLTAYTPCFRREAGSYGKDVRGLNRLHQFDKVEIVTIAHPDHSYELLEQMVAHVEGLLQALGLPYRVLRLCGGDMSFTSALTFDLEVFSAAQKRWLEVSSVSNFEDYQANRLQVRYRGGATKKMQLVHTLNGSSLALPRVVAALLENYQTPEGVRIPKVLQEWMHTDFLPWSEEGC